jgi:hypothetical protein
MAKRVNNLASANWVMLSERARIGELYYGIFYAGAATLLGNLGTEACHVIGLGFMVHGIAKWSHDPANFGKLLQQIGTAANADGLAILLGFAVDHSKRSADRFDAGSAVHGQHLARIAVRGFAQRARYRARFFVLEFKR